MKIALIVVSVLAFVAICLAVYFGIENNKLKKKIELLDPKGVITDAVVKEVGISGNAAPVKTVAESTADAVLASARRR